MPELFLDPLYLNERRVTNLVGADVVSATLSRLSPMPTGYERAYRNGQLASMARLLSRWLLAHSPPIRPIEQLCSLKDLAPGTLFTMHHDFYCRCVREGVRPSKAPPEAVAKFPDMLGNGKELRVVLRLHRDHVVPGSPCHMLSGRVANLFVLAQILDSGGGTISGVPLFVGHKMRGVEPLAGVFSWTGCEVHVDYIDSFSRVRAERPHRSKDLDLLRGIPESDIKQAFANILSEPDVPLDWGGEASDLISSHLRLDGRRVTTAFVFKGPSRFHPMTLADLGKNGDQINRLATEPADLLVVQHCHRVTPSVRTVLRSFCNQVGSTRRFCVIDGYDTLRVLRAYRQCGFDSRKGV